MTTNIRATPLFLRQLGHLLTRRRQAIKADQNVSKHTEASPSKATNNATDNSVEESAIIVTAAISPPPTFVDYSGEGDEPADLALIALIPAELATLNLPHFLPTDTAHATQPSTAAPCCPINACFLHERPLTEKEMNDAELAELIPLNLSKLNIPPKKNFKKETPTNQAPLPDLSKLKKA